MHKPLNIEILVIELLYVQTLQNCCRYRNYRFQTCYRGSVSPAERDVEMGGVGRGRERAHQRADFKVVGERADLENSFISERKEKKSSQ